MRSADDPCRNLLFNALSRRDRERFLPHLEYVNLERDHTLVAPGQRIERVYFLTSGIASITSESPGQGRTEVGIFGSEGMSATALLLGTDTSPHETFMQVVPGSGFCIDAARFVAIANDCPPCNRMLLRYVQTLMVQMAQSAVGNNHHQIETRLSRWLLMCHDRVDGDEIPITHEFMAMMIGAQRSGVTVGLHVLEGFGAIRSTRGKVLITDRAKLEELAGEIYGAPEAEYRRLIGPFGKGRSKRDR